MAEDEGRFGRVSIPRRAWAPPGVRPQATRQVVREYTHVYAAVAPAEGKMTSLILPAADTEMMSVFLEHVSSTFAKYFLVMQVDQAGWHRSKDLKIPENVRLIAQPAYSPEPESSWNMCGKKCAKNTWRISRLPLSMRSLTRYVTDSTSWKPILNASVR
jgi:hypothetical protein